MPVAAVLGSVEHVTPVIKIKRTRKKSEPKPMIIIEDPDIKLAERINVSVRDIHFIRNQKDSPEPWHVEELREFISKAGLFQIGNSQVTTPFSPFTVAIGNYRSKEREMRFEGEQEYPLNYTKLQYDFLFHCLDNNYPVQRVLNQFAKQYITGGNNSDLSKLTPTELTDLTYHLNGKPNYSNALLRIGIALGFTSEADFKPYLVEGIVTKEMVQRVLAKIVPASPPRPLLAKAG